MLYFAKWKVALVLAICLAGLAFTAPNFVSKESAQSIPDWLPHNQLSLGLDLQGGAHLLVEVDVDGVIKEYLETTRSDMRRALRKERIGYTGLRIKDKAVLVTVRKPEQLDQAVELIRDLAQPIGGGILGGGGTDIVVTTDGNQVGANLTEVAIRDRGTSAIEQTIEVIRRRVDAFGVAEASIQRQGADRVLIQLPGVRNVDDFKNRFLEQAKLAFRMVDYNASVAEAESGQLSPASELLEEYVDPEAENPPPAQKWVVRKEILVTGEMLVDASAGLDSRTNQPVVNFRFNQAGAKRFATVTQENVGRPFAIVLDGKVLSAPVIREPILGGSGQISGNFTFKSANELAILLRAGALPAALKFLEERTVGPDLGADTIEAGKMASMIGLALVVIFMIAAYGLFGLAANVALMVNMFLIAGGLSVLQATLTLPGIAGIVLTIGMAVDANVLIFERIREEIASGKSPFNAVEAGYKRAFTTIVDANVTTGIAALILFALGSGPVKGFAVTLGLGIASSMFTATVLTRLLVATYLKRRRPATLAI